MLDLFTLKLFNIVDELQEKSKKGYKYILDCRDNEYKYYVTYDYDHKIMHDQQKMDKLFHNILYFSFHDDHIEIKNKYNDDIIIIEKGKVYYK